MKVFFLILCFIFLIICLYIAAQNRKIDKFEKQELERMKQREAANADREQRQAEAQRAKQEASTGDHANDLDTMAHRVHDLATREARNL